MDSVQINLPKKLQNDAQHLNGKPEEFVNGCIGTNSCKSRRFCTIEEFVNQCGGNRPIRKLLLANNGIAAVKCMRSLRSWAYGTLCDSEAILFVCMATPEDIQANAEYVKMANKTVMVPGGSNVNNYANVELILQTAVANEVDAVWAGWGHASENPHLSKVLAEHNINFLGPPDYAMWALGDKVASTILAQSADMPTLPWSGSGIQASLSLDSPPKSTSSSDWSVGAGAATSTDQSHSSSSVTNGLDPAPLTTTTTTNGSSPTLVSSELYHAGCVESAKDALARVDAIGFPVMIKAAQGGGGKGIRKACNKDELSRFFVQVQNEVRGSPIFLMKCAQHVRHLEVQLLADQYGQAVSLFGRDCSVQRRHQKIIEEAPISIAPPDVIQAMEEAAVRLTKLVGYVGAGTVEYLFEPATNAFYFLELNPRLQVEHPCTEVVANVNLLACQLQIAMGIPLHRIKDIRELYGQSPWTSDPIPFDRAFGWRRPPSCSVIAARITSEDPDEGFKPYPGDVRELNFKSSRSVWGYFSVGSAGGIHEFADSQFGHCFSAASTREQACENLVLALKELSIRGNFRTTIEYLVKILESDEFNSQNVDTEWLDRRIAQKDQVEKPNILLGVACTALHVGHRRLQEARQAYELQLERGQCLPPNSLTNCADVTLLSGSTKFDLQVVKTGSASSYHLLSNNHLLPLNVYPMSDDGLLICHELASFMTYCHEDSQGYRIVIDNRTMKFAKEFDFSVLRSQSAGKLLQYTVSDGDHVAVDQVYALVEIMKLILELRCPAAGRIALKQLAGATLEPGSILARLELDDDDAASSSCGGPLHTYDGPLQPPNGFQACKKHQIHRRCSSQQLFNSTNSTTVASPPGNGVDKPRNASTDDLPLSTSPTCRTTPSMRSLADGPMKFARLLESLEQVLLGYCLPEPHFTTWLEKSVDRLMYHLRDPHLPLLELQDAISQMNGRLPPNLDQALRQEVRAYAGQVTSLMANFPSGRIQQLLDSHAPAAEGAGDSSRQQYQSLVQPLTELAERYKHGLRGRAVHVLSQLLMAYVAVERHFLHGQLDRCTRQLLACCQNPSDPTSLVERAKINFSGDLPESCVDFDDLEASLGCRPIQPSSVSPSLRTLIHPRSIGEIGQVMLSHKQLWAKNAFLLALLNRLQDRREMVLPAISAADLKDSLVALTELGAAGNSKVALAARQLLIALATPSYEVRRNQVESVFLAALDPLGSQFNPELLHELIASETLIFDILTDFFYHPSSTVTSAALEVYIRRSYAAYELTGIQHHALSDASSTGSGGAAHYIAFHFIPPPSSPSSLLKRGNGSGDDRCSDNRETKPSTTSMTNGSAFPVNGSDGDEQFGCMTAFNSLQDFEKSLPELLTHFRSFQSTASSNDKRFSFGGNGSMTSRSSQNGLLECTQEEENEEQTRQEEQADSVDQGRKGHYILTVALRQLMALTSNYTGDSDSDTKRVSSIDNVIKKEETSSASSADKAASLLEAFCLTHTSRLRAAGIDQLTFLIVQQREFPLYYTFRSCDSFLEDKVYRHLEPALAFQLELNRLEAYDLEQLPTLNRRMHLYLAKLRKTGGSDKKTPVGDCQLFVRCIIRHSNLLSKEASFDFLQSEAERTLVEALDALDMVHQHPQASRAMGNHIFLNFVPLLTLTHDLALLKTTIRRTVMRYACRFLRLRVSQAELKLRIRLGPTDNDYTIRIILVDEQGYDVSIHAYREMNHPVNGQLILQSIGSPPGPLQGHPVDLPHQSWDFLRAKRFQARRFNTAYVYDYPKLISQAVWAVWNTYYPLESLQSPPARHPFQPCVPSSASDVMVSCTELALGLDAELHPVERSPGSNTIGMVVWLVKLKTPDSSTSNDDGDGRSFIIIANDATHQAGSFGPAEDLTFHRASQLARRLGLPRIYLASNTGARIRVSDEVKRAFRVAWHDEQQPEKGYDYIYVLPEEVEKFNLITAIRYDEVVTDQGEVRYKITDIIGNDFDMSVENLRGSAMIAGETAAAYDDIPTVTIVTNRAIGIGAYLARLGQRVIQVKNSHIILTGAMALNKLLGREVYSSNSQLGGVQVMACNGVSHLVASDELLALQQAFCWLAYCPAQQLTGGLPSPSLMLRPLPRQLLGTIPNAWWPSKKKLGDQQSSLYLAFDPIDRPVEYTPSKDRPNDDPRWLITGVMMSQLTNNNASPTSTTKSTATNPADRWLPGFFDWGSFRESLGAWAGSVLIGRARLGGLACGVITPETHSVVCRVPADPANLATESQLVNQAGQVWYPDSAYKTAQAIADFDRERLPLFIFANWRGFSGGMKDMYDQVLKFGSMIIDALHRYRQPVFVYLPPYSQLRGGAWVVVDPAINPRVMEMYADPSTCRAGVLEPEGTVEIKYRLPDLVKTMHRLDEECQRLLVEIAKLKTVGSPSEQLTLLQNQLREREKRLQPYYHQVALHFADLHDTPGRLASCGLVHGLVDWRRSRRFFYVHLRRALLEQRAVELIQECYAKHGSPEINPVDSSSTVESFNSTTIAEADLASPLQAAQWVPKLSLTRPKRQQEAEQLLHDWLHQSLPDVNWQARNDLKIGDWLARQLGEWCPRLLRHIPDQSQLLMARSGATTDGDDTSSDDTFFRRQLDKLRKRLLINRLKDTLDRLPSSVGSLASILGHALSADDQVKLANHLLAGAGADRGGGTD